MCSEEQLSDFNFMSVEAIDILFLVDQIYSHGLGFY